MASTILKLLLNNNYAIIETWLTDKDNCKPYLTRKIVKIKHDPEIFVNGELLE